MRSALLPPLAATLLWLAPGEAAALQPLVVTPDQPVTQLRTALEYLEDPEGRLRLDDLRDGPLADRLRANPSGRDLSFGNTRSAYWFRLGLANRTSEDIGASDHRQLDSDIGRIRNAAEHMRRLLDELLELSRVGRVVQPPQRAALTEVALEAAEMQRKAVTERGIELRIALDLPTVFADRNRILQVFQNLLDNAIRYLGDQDRPRIEIGWRQEELDRVCFVRDNGVGIDPRHHESVFELFRRLQPGLEGTGVGLSLVRRIVESHGGRIWVESEGAGTGSTFCLSDPRRRRLIGFTARR